MKIPPIPPINQKWARSLSDNSQLLLNKESVSCHSGESRNSRLDNYYQFDQLVLDLPPLRAGDDEQGASPERPVVGQPQRGISLFVVSNLGMRVS
jgi:hypothetical protein